MTTHDYNVLKKKLPAALPSLQKLYEWLARADKQALKFEARNECACPLAVFLSETFKTPIEVGDDDLSHDGLFLCELPSDYREFVRAFDGFVLLEYVTPRDTMELCKLHAKEWRITP